MKPIQIPKNLASTVERAVAFAASQLELFPVFYPFAAVKDKSGFKCVTTDHLPNTHAPIDMIEVLQWRLIDIAMERPVQTILAYAGKLKNGADKKVVDGVAMEVTDEANNNFYFFIPYIKRHGKLAFYQPLTESEK